MTQYKKETTIIVIWAVILFILLFLSSCGSDGSQAPDLNQDPYLQQTLLTGGVWRFVDPEWNVVCYRIYNNGISCVPLSLTERDF